jgi:putative endonuclease
MTDKKELGNKGEGAAAQYLERQGCLVLARNQLIDGQEIDLIAKDGKKIILVEVKTRRVFKGNQIAETTVPLSKIQERRLKRAAATYCAINHLSEKNIRLDLIMIIAVKNQKVAYLKHYRDII